MDKPQKQANVEKITMSAKEAAAYLGISYWLILEMTKRHKIPYIACGNRKLFRKEALDKWMEEQEKKTLGKSNQYGVLKKIY